MHPVFVRAVKEVQKHQKAAEEMLVVKSGKNSVTIQKNHIYYIENKAKKLVFHTDKKVLEIYAAMLQNSRSAIISVTIHTLPASHLLHFID